MYNNVHNNVVAFGRTDLVDISQPIGHQIHLVDAWNLPTGLTMSMIDIKNNSIFLSQLTIAKLTVNTLWENDSEYLCIHIEV